MLGVVLVRQIPDNHGNGRLWLRSCRNFDDSPRWVLTLLRIIGSFSLQLAQLYPQLRFIVQDQAAMVEQGLSIWEKKLPTALESGRAQFMEHDFFTPNPVKEADIYWMRNVLCVALPLPSQVPPHT